MAQGFFERMEQIRKKYEKRMVLLHKKVSADLFRRVILKTPVDTGRARGNWMIGINTIPQTVSEDANGKEALRNVTTGISGIKLGDTAVLANSVEYVGALEYGGYPNPPKKGSWDKKRKEWVIKSAGGYSKQAPVGMVRTTIEEYMPTLNKAIAEAKRETR